MSDLTDNQVRALLKKAGSGPWDVDGPVWNRTVWRSSENRVCFMAHSNGLDDDRDIATSELVAAAPDLARALLQARADAEAALVEAQAEVARLSTLEGAADRVLRFITDPDWADQNSEVFRTTPWQALYNEMQKDRGDFPAMVRTFLEAFACADFRDELRRAALLPVARDEMEG